MWVCAEFLFYEQGSWKCVEGLANICCNSARSLGRFGGVKAFKLCLCPACK